MDGWLPLRFHLLFVFLAMTAGWISTFSELGMKSSSWLRFSFNRIAIGLCTLSIVYEEYDLLALTGLQAMILTIVACVFAVELGETARRNCYDVADVYHHILGILGIVYLICNQTCGGMMIRLLLDITTHWMSALRGPLNRRNLSLYLGEKIYWTYFVLVRFLWYPNILFQTVWVSQDYALKAILSVWLIFSFGFHVVMFKSQFELRTFSRFRHVRAIAKGRKR